jgi:hypothetical protein
LVQNGGYASDGRIGFMPIADLLQMFYKFTQPGKGFGPGKKTMNEKRREVAQRPSAALAQIALYVSFCPKVSFFGEGTEKNDCFSVSL